MRLRRLQKMERFARLLNRLAARIRSRCASMSTMLMRREREVELLEQKSLVSRRRLTTVRTIGLIARASCRTPRVTDGISCNESRADDGWEYARRYVCC